MGRVGGVMSLMGVVSALLSFTDYELRLLFWIETWGDGVAWILRIALVVVGLGLMLAENASQPDQEQEVSPV